MRRPWSFHVRQTTVILQCISCLNHIHWQEDANLLSLIQDHGQNNWSVVATYLTGRSAKQCCERSGSSQIYDIKISTICGQI